MPQKLNLGKVMGENGTDVTFNDVKVTSITAGDGITMTMNGHSLIVSVSSATLQRIATLESKVAALENS